MVTDLQVATRKVVSVNPATGETLRQFQATTDTEVHAAVARARATQPAWSEIGARRRVAVLREFQRLLHQKKSEVATLITREAGKPGRSSAYGSSGGLGRHAVLRRGCICLFARAAG